MSIFRLVSSSLLILVIVATLAAQSAPDKSSLVASLNEPAQLSSSSANPFSNFQTGLKPNAADRILLGDYRPKQSQFSVPRNWLRTKPDSQDDHVCLKMRVYKLARDGPNTDSMHPAGYSTCSPAARFQAHSIIYTIPSQMP
jgi:hypothetical protein